MGNMRDGSGKTAADAASGRASLFPLLALSLLLILPSIYAADIIGGTMSCFGGTISLMNNFNGTIWYMVMLMVALIAIAFMAGTAFSRPEWTVWAKTEGVTLAWSVVLVAFVLFGFSSSCFISNAMLTGSSLNSGGSSCFGAQTGNLMPNQRASWYLGQLLNTYGVSVAAELVQSSISDQLGSMSYAYWSIPVFDGGGLAYSANKRAWSAHKELLADIYLPLMISITAQKLLMDIGIPGVAGIILPAAIMFRMFFLTRDIGNLLLAFSFAAYFAFPLTYVFFFDATAQVQANVFEVNPCTNPTEAALNPFGKLSLGYDGIIGDKMQRVGFMATQAIIAPNLALVITITMAMALNKAFRGMVA